MIWPYIARDAVALPPGCDKDLSKKDFKVSLVRSKRDSFVLTIGHVAGTLTPQEAMRWRYPTNRLPSLRSPRPILRGKQQLNRKELDLLFAY